MSDVIRIDTRELDRIAGKLNRSRKAIGKRIAFEIEKQAMQNAPIQTSALENSHYVVTQDFDGYEVAKAKVKELNPKAETAPHPTPEGNIIANVGPCVEYADYVELGTSRMAAQPYLTPAVEKVAQKYNDGSAWKELVE